MFTTAQTEIIEQAIALLEQSFRTQELAFTSPDAVMEFCRLSISHFEHEVFSVLFLDSQHKLIEFKTMFRGTIDSASVYPREVAKEALQLNAAAVIFTHNHPSGLCEPSQSDLRLTTRLIDALNLFDIRVLDHIIVSKINSISFAERGLL